eukprot:Ihof_evm25s18 gene=Ihof_evmTU25s18
MSVPETLRLHIGQDSIRIEPLYNDGRRVPKMAELDRKNYGIRAVEAALLCHSPVMVVHGIVGIIHLLGGPYLIVITERKRVAVISDHEIWQLIDVDFIPFSSSLNLTQEQKEDEEKYISMLTTLLTSGAFYFAYSYNLTHSAQRIAAFPPAHEKKSLWEKADKRLMWNYALCREFIRAGHLDEFILPLMQGWTRFNARGIDFDGNVANFCEQEQIIQSDGKLASYVQTRGSIPVFWTQHVNLKYAPPIVLQDQDHFSAFARHCQTHIQIYGPTVLVNLVDKKGPDLMLSNAFREQYKHFGSEHLKYVEFDFHKECSQNRWHRLSLLMEEIGLDHQHQQYFAQARNGKVLAIQRGVFRTNCMDCLDRTNVVQSMLARLTLRQQLNDFGILSAGESIESIPELSTCLRHMWADHADALSMIYSGTGALKNDFTRTGVRSVAGMLQDGRLSLMRYYLNNFGDGKRQDSIDLLLNHYQVSPHLPSPFTEEPNQQRLLRILPVALIGSFILLLLGLLLPS